MPLVIVARIHNNTGQSFQFKNGITDYHLCPRCRIDQLFPQYHDSRKLFVSSVASALTDSEVVVVLGGGGGGTRWMRCGAD